MNTIGWRLTWKDRDIYYALHGDVALRADFQHAQTVYQYRHMKWGTRTAQDYLVQQTGRLEGDEWRLVGEPVEFDLTVDARAQISGTDPGHWVHAPLLREEIMAGINPPISGHMVWHATVPPPSPAPGAIYLDSSASVVKVWTGTSWTEMHAAALGIEMAGVEYYE